MSEATQSTKVVRFGVFEADLRTAELRKQGIRIRLPGQSFQVLEALLLRPGELVTREELKQKLWPADSFGDFEHGLNAAVKRLREALGDSSDSPRFVETLPRRGYRFIAPVNNGRFKAKLPDEFAPFPSQNGHVPVTADALKRVLPTPKSRWISAVLTLLVVISVCALLFVKIRDRRPPDARSATQRDPNVVPLTTLPGQAFSPSFSPDGSQVVFAWDGGNSNFTNRFNLYAKVIGSENIEQLTYEPGDWIVPAWSPDGSTIAFARAGGQNPGIFSVPARGGAEKKLADAAFNLPQYFLSLSWSPDGHHLLYDPAEGLRILTPETGEVRPIETPSCEVSNPAFSPDGKWIAFTCNNSEGFYIDLLSTNGGPSKHLVQEALFGGFAWSEDSQRVIFASYSSRLREININGKGLRELAFATAAAYQPAIAPRGERLAFATEVDNPEIRRLDIHTGQGLGVFFPASVGQAGADISPDGKRIAFVSMRSGTQEVWEANLDGSDAVQLSNFHAFTGSPRWSPDGRQVAFDSRVSGEPALYLVDPSTARPKRISTNNVPAEVPTWSPDGEWIYFTSVQGGVDPGFLYKVAAEGGNPEKMTETRGFNIKQSKDRKFLYFFANSSVNAEIHVLDLASGREQALPGMPKVVYPPDWALGSKGIYFVDGGQKLPSIGFYDFSAQRVTRKIPLDKQPYIWSGLSLSPDETWLAYSAVNHAGSNLMLVEGFR